MADPTGIDPTKIDAVLLPDRKWHFPAPGTFTLDPAENSWFSFTEKTSQQQVWAPLASLHAVRVTP